MDGPLLAAFQLELVDDRWPWLRALFKPTYSQSRSVGILAAFLHFADEKVFERFASNWNWLIIGSCIQLKPTVVVINPIQDSRNCFFNLLFMRVHIFLTLFGRCHCWLPRAPFSPFNKLQWLNTTTLISLEYQTAIWQDHWLTYRTSSITVFIPIPQCTSSHTCQH